MGNIISYLKWRGDLPLSEYPFNKVDNLVLSYLSYFDFGEIVPNEENHEICIKDAVCRYMMTRNNSVYDDMTDISFLEEIGRSERFCNAKLCDYESILDTEIEFTQFSAIHIILSDGTDYIAFRGTDNSIIGWQEDFHLGFEVAAAQKYAAKYLERTMKNKKVKYRIGGHSKGGNLALYAAMMSNPEMKEKITAIYMNDSPGLCPEVMQDALYREIKTKITKIVPEFSVIGMLFDKDTPKTIVKSNADSFMQHDALTWQVQGDDFVAAERLHSKCISYNEIFERWIDSADLEQKKQFTDDFFGALGAGGATTMREVTNGGVDGFEDILFAMATSDRNSKKVAGKLLKSCIVQIKQTDYRKLFRQKKVLQGVAVFFIGALCIVLPGLALHVIGTAVFLWLLLFSVFRIYKLWNEKRPWTTPDKVKMVCYSVISILEMLCILFNNIVVISTNVILGGFLLWRAYRQGKKAMLKKAEKKKSYRLYLTEAVFVCVMALVVLARSGDGAAVYILPVGTYLTITGMVMIGKEWFETIKKQNTQT